MADTIDREIRKVELAKEVMAELGITNSTIVANKEMEDRIKKYASYYRQVYEIFRDPRGLE